MHPFARLLAALALLLAPGALSSTVELDAQTLWASVSASTEQDLLVLFYTPPQARMAVGLAATLARRMGLAASPSTILGLYDLALHGWPSGLHVHHAEDGAVILFPAGGREPAAYDWLHDPLSVWPEGGGAAASVEPSGEAAPDGSEEGGREHDHDERHHHHHHGHAQAPSANGVLRWLKGGASSFPSDIPLVALADVWEGREDKLFTAVLSGLEALHKRMAALQAENARLQAELEQCASGQRA